MLLSARSPANVSSRAHPNHLTCAPQIALILVLVSCRSATEEVLLVLLVAQEAQELQKNVAWPLHRKWEDKQALEAELEKLSQQQVPQPCFTSCAA